MEVKLIDVNFSNRKGIFLEENLKIAFSAVGVCDLRKFKEVIKKVDINAQDENGMTFLHHAAVNEDDDMIDLILAQEGLDARIEDNFGRAAAWAVIDVNGATEEAMRISDKLEACCYPTAFGN